MSRTQTIKILPYQFIHILDTNSNVSRVELGPQTYIILDHEKLLTSTAQNMVTPSKRSYSKVANPVVRDESGTPIVDQYGQVKLKHGEVEYRFFKDFSEAYALYPGEKLQINCAPLQVVEEDCAIRLRANRDFVDGEMVRSAGDEWLFMGPATYYPRIEEDVVKMEKAIIVDEKRTVRIRAA
jgi:major vault protein